ncbi:hypothetical protein HU200_014353 [Digitaria exilis]|uniref:F-box protein AT5G49610-like beta-propeller domain-containing protein n=1 Tax=Digitaria exilis TaxID=1010633 RepID=A0A835FBV3_9POAL|nr:hypothetical protein HU200_014353 [Digitaria exilis]
MSTRHRGGGACRRRRNPKRPPTPPFTTSATTSSSPSSSASPPSLPSSAWPSPAAPSSPPSAPPPPSAAASATSTPPPLLGLFFEPYGPYIPSFAPLSRRSDPDLAAAVRGADFFLTRVPATDDASPGWGVLDCRGGYLLLLLVNCEAKEMAAYNRHADRGRGVGLPRRPLDLLRRGPRVHAMAFSSCTREWRVLPWEEPAPEQQGWLPQGMQVNGSLYWAHKEQAYMMVLDTATLQFSSIDLPGQMKGQGHLYRVGKPKMASFASAFPMASQEPPRRRRRLPPTAKPQEPAATTIHDLGEDLLLDIFLRLPSLPSLVRAALACRAFLAAVRSSPAFRRRFRALQPHPLVGFFFEVDGCDVPSFSPVRRRSDPDLAAAVRGADVFLTRLPYHEDADPGWRIADCHGGCLLLLNSNTDQIAAYNPLTRALHLLPMPPEKISKGRRGKFNRLDFFLLLSDETPGSFRVVCMCHDKSRLRAVVYSSGTKEWQILPWSEAAPTQPSGKKYWLRQSMRANGNLYLAHAKQAYMIVLDTTALHFSFMDLPDYLKGQAQQYMIGETKDGKLCMVFTFGFILFIAFRGVDADGVEKWIADDGFLLEEEILRVTEGTRGDEDELILKVTFGGLRFEKRGRRRNEGQRGPSKGPAKAEGGPKGSFGAHLVVTTYRMPPKTNKNPPPSIDPGGTSDGIAQPSDGIAQPNPQNSEGDVEEIATGELEVSLEAMGVAPEDIQALRRIMSIASKAAPELHQPLTALINPSSSAPTYLQRLHNQAQKSRPYAMFSSQSKQPRREDLRALLEPEDPQPQLQSAEPVPWPRHFNSANLPQFDGATDPKDFLLNDFEGKIIDYTIVGLRVEAVEVEEDREGSIVSSTARTRVTRQQNARWGKKRKKTSRLNNNTLKHPTNLYPALPAPPPLPSQQTQVPSYD